jgi:spore germination cell wall hydrolase CwlJ-like protein
MKAQVNSINQSLTTWSARLLKVLGLTAVAVILFTVVDAKFDHLRQANSRMPEHMITAEQRMKELDCLTRNIYWEAASEPFEGKVGVAQVTLNRVESGKFAPTVCGVV